MTGILIFVIGMAIVAGVVPLMMRIDRIHRQRIQREREAWKAAGGVGPCPGDTSGGSGDGTVNIGF